MGRRTTFAYDLAGRQTAERWLTSSGGTIRTESYTYDSGGQLIGASDPDATLTFTYDFLGRETGERTSGGGTGQPNITLTSAYDKVGDRTSLTDNFTSVGRTTYTYDALDRLTQVARDFYNGAVAGPQVVFTYDVGSRRTTAIRTVAGVAGSVNTSYGYDGLDRVTAILHSTNTVYLTTFTYDYDAGSRLTHDTVNGVGTSYSYDLTDQLTTVTGSRAESYDYDATGNRDSTGYSTTTGNRVTAASTAVGNFTYTYDDEGNRSSQTDTGSGAVTTYSYDYRDRLTGVTIKDSGGAVTYQNTYTYDALDRRIGVAVDADGAGPNAPSRTWTVYDGREEYADVSGSGTLQTRYLHGPAVDELLARTDSGGTTAWYLTDRQGSVRNLASSSGTLIGTITYDGFGRQLTNTGTTDKFGYDGLPHDAGTGLDYTPGRYYDAVIGSWTQPDPSGFGGGDPNLSRYVGNSPTNYTDPSGLAPPPNFFTDYWRYLTNPGDMDPGLQTCQKYSLGAAAVAGTIATGGMTGVMIAGETGGTFVMASGFSGTLIGAGQSGYNGDDIMTGAVSGAQKGTGAAETLLMGRQVYQGATGIVARRMASRGNIAPNSGSIPRIGTPKPGIAEVPIKDITPTHPTPRPGKSIPDTASILSGGYDVSQPIPVLRMPDGRLIAAGGNHRLAAMECLGESTIPAKLSDWASIPDKVKQFYRTKFPDVFGGY